MRTAPPEARRHLADAPSPPVIEPGLYRCGDWCEEVSINGALISGRKAGESVLRALGEPVGE